MAQNNKIWKAEDGPAFVQDSVDFMEQVLDWSFMRTRLGDHSLLSELGKGEILVSFDSDKLFGYG